MFSRFGVSFKLLAGFGLVLSILAVISGLNLIAARQISSQVALVKEHSYQNAVGAIQLVNLAERILGELRNAGEAADIRPLAEAEKDFEVFKGERSELNDRGLPELTAAKLNSFGLAVEEAFATGARMIGYAAEQEFMTYVPEKQKFDLLAADVSALGEVLRSEVSGILYSDLEQINSASSRSVRIGTFLTLFGILLGILLALGISRDICRPITQVLAMIRELGHGNLAERLALARRDEIGQIARAMDDMAESLHTLVGKLSHSATELSQVSSDISMASGKVSQGAQAQAEGIAATSAAITQISTSSEEIGRGVEVLNVATTESTSSVLEMAASIEEVACHAEELAQSVEKVSSSVAQMTASIRQVAGSASVLQSSSDTTASSIAQMDASIREVEQNARDTAGITEKVCQHAESGKSAVDATINGIKEIRSSAQVLSEVITTLSQRASSVGSILSVIDDVTDQTNLLALNAAIIAAQAGDHGKGFAVVAGEIRDLAERTSLSTREIASVIGGVQEETRKAVEAIGRAERSVGDGERLSLQSGEKLVQIVAEARRAMEQMERISLSTAEQAKGSQAIRTEVGKISDMVSQIATATREQSSGTVLITQAAEKMRELTLQVKTSTFEQNSSGKVIARSMEEITEMIRKIHRACDEQIRGSRQIVEATEGIRASSEVSVESSGVLDGAALSLGRQTAVMRKEMEVFRLRDQRQRPISPG